MLVNSKVVSFNILANRFSYYSTSNHKPESTILMKHRYKSIIALLWALQADIYLLQEVDQHFYNLIRYSDFKKKYYISYLFCKARDDEPNKDEIGLLMMINKKQYFISKALNFKINTLEDKNEYSLFHFKGEPSSFIGFNNCLNQPGVVRGNVKKMSQILIVEKNHHPLILINCHFEGRPDRQDLRIAQFKECCHVAQNCITKYNLEHRLLIGGDFNEPKQKDILKLYLSEVPFNLKLLNIKSDYTSNLRYQKNKESKKWEQINRIEKLDYLIGSDSFKITKETVLPKSDIRKYPDWSRHFDMNIYNNLSEIKNWPSDHRLVSFLLEFNTESHLSVRKKRSQDDKKKTIKIVNKYKLL